MEEKIVQFKGTIVRCVCDKDNFKVYAANVDQNEYPDVQINKYKNVSITGDLPDLVFDVEYEITAQEKQTKYGISYYVLNIRRDIPTTQEDVYEFLREILRMDTLCPSRDTTFNLSSFISNNSPLIILLVSLSAIEKIV